MTPPPVRAASRAAEVGRVLLALGLAVFLWYFVGSQDEAEILASGPIELRNVPPGLEVVGQSAQRVEVRLRGASALLRDAPPGILRAVVDLSGEGRGERSWFLGVDSVEAPAGVQVMRVDPSQVVLELERTLTATVRVSPRVLGEPATGFEIHRIAIEPSELRVEGPESLLSELDRITTEPISAQGLRETYARRLQLEVDPALRPAVREVEVRLRIGEERELRDLELRVRASGSAGATDCRVEPPRIAASLRIPKSLTARVSPETLFAEVSCEGLGGGTHRVVPRLRFAEAGVETIAVVAFEPEAVEVTVGSPAATTPAVPSWASSGAGAGRSPSPAPAARGNPSPLAPGGGPR